MKNVILIFAALMLTACDRIHGWFPGYTDPQSSSKQPTFGCKEDIKVQYTNNCSGELVMYFIEVVPGTTFNCENMSEIGILAINERKTVTVHKGKLGYFVFAEDRKGKCAGGQRKAEAWVNCENSTSNEANFSICN